jgi:hypothetical protein
MSARSGVFTKYLVEFTTAPGSATGVAAAAAGAVAGALGAAAGTKSLKVSNDILVGDVCIDADVSVQMSRGTRGATFKITLYDLPEPMVKSLRDTPALQASVRIKLGYFDTKVQLVLEGIYEKVESSTAAERLVTTVTGREKAFFACASTPYTSSLQEDVSFAKAVESVLSSVTSNDKLPKDCVDGKPQVKAALPSDLMHNPSFHDKNGVALGALDKIARQAKAELLVVDKKVFLGSPITYDSIDPAQLDYGTNLAKFEPMKLKISGASKLNLLTPVPDKEIKGFKFTTIGDPTMRPGQQIVVKNIKDYDSPEFLVRQVEHNFSASAGYTCVGAAVERPTDGEAALEIDAALERSAASAATEITDRIRSQAFDNPVVEIGLVKAAADAYLVDLYYGQPAAASETQPSINAAIKLQDDHVFPDKPIISPFAWRKCGLVTPVYPGMKAVIVHNRALASDGMVAGYIWSKQPDFAPPENQSGDWWLCLPVDFDATQPPGDSTKAVNDLTANNGCRVMELKGLKITVGADGLKEIGKRPTPGDAEACTIEHASGAVITVKNGEINVDTGAGPKLTLSSSDITLSDGKLNVKLAEGKLAIG